MANKIFVTQPSLPPLGDFVESLHQIWGSKVLTNGGAFHQELENALSEHLGVKHISLFNNGTIALLVALQALNIKGEVITTPYSFVATSNAILWNGLKPVFIDIDPETLNLDPEKISEALTDKTSAIMPVHCYGKPCDVIEIEKVAKKHGIKVIYDAAHAFSVRIGDESLLNYGDLSVLSFHATKVFNTLEGGAIVCHTKEMKTRIDQLKNFGFVDEITVVEAGINGKMSEVNAAFGLHQLGFIKQEIRMRAVVAANYEKKLSGCKGLKLPRFENGINFNFSYYPIFINDEFPVSRDDLYEKLKGADIYARRYFYPLISDFPMYQDLSSANPASLPNAKKAASEVLCLPIYSGLTEVDQNRVVDVILGCMT